jgi:hypothetical protein
LRLSALVLAGAVLIAFLWKRSLVRSGATEVHADNFALLTFLLAFPFWIMLYTANFEFAVWFVLVAAFYFLVSGRENIAALLFGIAAAMKIFPIALLGLLLAKRRFGAVFLACGAAVIVSLLSLWLLCPDIGTSWRLTNQAIDHTRPFYMLALRPGESGFDHTLWVLLKRLMRPLPPPQVLAVYLRFYLIAVGIAGVAAFFLRVRTLPFINQVLFLVTAMVFLTPVSYDYTLVHLYIPFALLCAAALRSPEQSSPALLTVFSLLAFVLSAQSEFIAHGLRYAGQLKAVALLGLLIVAFLYRFPSDFDEQVFSGKELPASV